MLFRSEAAQFALAANRKVYVHVARGSIEINGEKLSPGDAAKISGEVAVALANGAAAEVLLFDLPA